MTRYTKIAAVDAEAVDDSLALLHPVSLEVRMLNETAAILWNALDLFPTAAELAELIHEARPELSAETSTEIAEAFLQDLLEAGFIEVQASDGSESDGAEREGEDSDGSQD